MNDRGAEGDFEIITPPVNLRAKVRRMSAREAANFDPVAAAETALGRLSNQFTGWMDEETRNLHAVWTKISRDGLVADHREVLFRTAHDIKGQAATLGFPLAGRVADSLCHLLESVPDSAQIPPKLIEQHVQAIRAIVAEDARDAGDQVASTLADRLAVVTDDFVASLGPVAED